MHDTARETGREFFCLYARGGAVLDVGAMDVNGTLREFVPSGMSYCGCDITAGPNVDVVVPDSGQLPFPNEEFDLVVSTSCFEHDRMFWMTFLEMARVVKPGGFIYVSAPVSGPVHRHPIDAWRFYPDAGIALAQWAELKLEPISLVESFVRPPGHSGWSDFVSVWAKRPFDTPRRIMREIFLDAIHAH